MAGAGEFCEVFLTGARPRADMIVGKPGDGWKVAMAALGVERGTLLMPQQLGFEREAEEALRLARERGTTTGLTHQLGDSCIPLPLLPPTPPPPTPEVTSAPP